MGEEGRGRGFWRGSGERELRNGVLASVGGTGRGLGFWRGSGRENGSRSGVWVEGEERIGVGKNNG